MENNTEVFKELRIQQPYDPAVPLLGTYPKKENTNLKRYLWPVFLALLLIMAKSWKQPKVSINR